MNMKKTFGVCATLLAALLCAVPQSAHAMGKIRSVDVYTLGEDGKPQDCSGRVLVRGETVYINFRLVNLGWGQTSADPSYTNVWQFIYPNAPVGSGMEWYANRPRLGLWMGGVLRKAELENMPGTASSFHINEWAAGECHYTDITFKYTVQAGDIALPILLANRDGTGPATGDSPLYYLRCNSGEADTCTHWVLVDSKTWSNTNRLDEFTFGPADLASDPDFASDDLTSWDPVVARGLDKMDADLNRAGVRVQALDFDNEYYNRDAGIWRAIKQGSCEVASTGFPSIEIPGGAPEPMQFYVWTKDSSIADIQEDGDRIIRVEEKLFRDGQTRRVGTVQINAGDEKVELNPVFLARGAVGDTTEVFLAATPTNIYLASGDLITNFISRTITVTNPPLPSISVTLDGNKPSQAQNMTADKNYSAKKKVNVELSRDYPDGALDVPLLVTVDGHPELDARDYVAMSRSGSGGNTDWIDTLTIGAGARKDENDIHLYANRGAVTIKIEVDTNRLDAAARAFFTGGLSPVTVVVDAGKPEITSALPDITDAEANVPKEITINVADAYGELRDPCRYTVYWSKRGGVSDSDYVPISDLAATVDGKLTFTVTYPQKDDYTSRFYVKNQDGKETDRLDPNAVVHVKVKGQKVVKATVLQPQRKFPEDGFNEQDVVMLDFGGEEFSMPNGEEKGYIFLVPRNANSSNLVECSDLNIDDDHPWMAGYEVYAGATNAGPFQMTLYDGNSKGITMTYGIVVRTAEYWDEGDIVTTWSGQDFSFSVTNVVPAVTQVSMSGTRLKVNGGTMGAHASLGVSKTFTAQTTEPSDIDLYADDDNGYHDDQKAFTTEWSFDYGNGAPDVKYVYGPPSTTLSYAFTQAGTCTVTVRMCDKDMDHNRDVWGPEFTFSVVVDAKPSVTLSPANGLEMFYETSIGQSYSKINLGLSMVPTAEINVHIDVTRVGADDGNYPMPVLSSYDVAFGGSSPYTTNAPIWFTTLDGTALGESQGYIISAVVTTTTENADGVAWSNLYSVATLPVTIVNNDPEIMTRAGTNEIWKAENENFKIEFTVRDVPADVHEDNGGLSVTWQTSEGFSTNYTITSTSSSGQYTTYKGSSPMFSFTQPGSKTVTLLIEDKDGGFDQQQWKYYVVPSKALRIYPRQPNQFRGQGGSLSAFSDYYTGAAGLGDGRVWADGAVVDFNNFVHKYTFDPRTPSVDVYARGYKVGEIDNGSLQPGPDITIDANGNHYKSGVYSSYYESKSLDGLDSYFYCWILDAAGEGGGNYTGSLLNGTFLPAVEAQGEHVANGQQLVTLAEYEEDAESYPLTVLEAIFSKERYPADNVGDINQDNIPDVYAVSRGYAGGKLFEVASGGDGGGDAAGSAADVRTRLTDFNDDGDTLPADSMTTGNILITADSWKATGEPFTAELEVRGFHSGLNYRTVKDGLNYNVRGAWVSEPSFSPAESNAIVYMNKKLNIHEFTWPVDATNAAHAANWREGLNKDNSWIPENRTDPTIDDTDSDGFPDGYEYYFWYMSTVGWVDDKGEWKRLEGEKFQLDNIAKGVPIPADDIAEAFNPTVPAGKFDAAKRDTDGDGLTDMEELAIGTNPVHWDSDGDGMSDLWEILRGLDPLKKDSSANADGDFMALVDLPEDYAILSFTTNKVTEYWALPNNGYGYVDAETSVILGSATGTVAGVRVYRYGDDKSPWTPIARSSGLNGAKPVPELEKMDQLDIDAVLQANGFPPEGDGEEGGEEEGDEEGGEEGSDVDPRADALKESFVAITNQHLRLVHDQVYAQYGFDPRTGWSMNDKGYVAARWDVSKSSAKYAGETGKAMNTAKYTALHEYLLLKYRYNTRPVHSKVNPEDDTDKTYSLSKDKANVKNEKMTMADVLNLGTTNPNVPYEDKTYGTLGASTSSNSGGDDDAGGENESSPTTHSNTNHGADTDNDGVPDGWELYVGHNPNTDSSDDLKDTDGDELGLVAEYAGTDSCDAYAFATNATGAVTIYAHHPGNEKGWYNKFFPTDPHDRDTDGDGIDDKDEGNTWKASFRYGNLGSSDDRLHTYTFIYGPNEGKPEADDGTICIRGGGLNPCSVDTDGDMLPDPWERNFAGVVFTAEGQPAAISLREGIVRLIRRSDGLAGDAVAVQPYITAGMDGTHGWRMEDAVQTGDAFTNNRQTDPFTGTKRNFDFDHDGLQNFQEYLVQSLRHLRYDDKDTPLLGQWMPDGTPASREFFAFVPMNVMDGETFYAKCKAAGFPATGAWKFNEIGYFARPPHEWDLTAQNTYSKKMVNYDDHGYRVMLRPQISMGSSVVKAGRYCSTDPRMFDTDEDGMDDYYEIFHGLNPLLGSIGDPSEGYIAYDVIAQAYGGRICWWYNAWTGWPMMSPFGDGNSPYDAMKYPWAMGTPQADADGDGILNSDEALLVNLGTPMPTHTDPTPLWLTDSTSPGKASYTVQYYQMDPDQMVPDFAMGAYPWSWNSTTDLAAEQKFWMFSFEENEGYDSDHDGLNDLTEGTTTGTVTSDPLNFSDPDRRQALWFPGANSAAVSFNSSFRRELDLEYSFLKTFTVEAWIRPDVVDRDQVIIERAVNCTPDTLSNNVSRIRANFRIGLMADGRLYGQFDTTDAIGTGTGDSSPKVVSSFTQEAGKWTHVALAFNGRELKLYVDGKVAGTFQTSLIPANGIIVLAQDAVPDNAAFPVLVNGYEVQDSAVVLGARALGKGAIKLKPATDMNKTTWADFDSFYAGYIDEVRVWDGERTSAQIASSMETRLSFANVKSLREEVYASWRDNGTRNDNDGYPNLPAELVLHYNFQTLYGALDAADVAHEPVGFTKNVIDNVRVNGGYVPGGLSCGWWYGLKDTVGSSVYRNYNVVPWIPNTCAHLPAMDGSAGDSWYWGEYLGGVAYASEILPELGASSTASEQKIQFSNSASPYPYYNYVGDRVNHRNALRMLYDIDSSCAEVYMRSRFDLRTGLVGCSDLVPLGGAFAKRVEEMWDGDGAATAWELAGWDDDADGIPDWWETVAITRYGAASDFGWDSKVVRNGVEMTSREAYLRDLAGGMLPNGTVNPAFSTKADTNNNGLPDWWENLYGIKSAVEDSDGDGLSNYAEFLIGEGFVNYGFPNVKPTMSHSLGQVVPDYFLRVGQLYLGEMFSDHDMMEDVWEDQFDVGKVSRAVWDALGDPDHDGWSNFAEARANTDPTRQNVNAIDDFTVPQYPVPTVNVTVTGDTTLDGPVVVKAYPMKSGGTDIPDAVWTTGSDDESFTKYIGINPNTVWRMTLGPGAVKPGSLKVCFKDPTWWHGTATNRTYGTLATAEWMPWLSDRSQEGSSVMGDIVTDNTANTGNTVGSINYETGVIDINFTELQGDVVWNHNDKNGTSSGEFSYIHLAPSYVFLEWKSKVPSGNTSVTLGLADSLPNSDKYPSLGHLREGEYIFTALLDKNDNGEWDPGELYGAVSHVDVGWSSASCAIELKETTPQMVRINIAGAIAASDFAAANALTDRGGVTATAGFAPNEASRYPGTNMPANASTSLTKVRVVRNWINGSATNAWGNSYQAVVLERDLDLTKHPNLTEAELLVDGVYDLDWGTLLPAYGGGAATLETVTYRIVIGNKELAEYERFDNNLPVLFSNQFESRLWQTPTVPDPNLSEIVYAGQPTFRWSHANSINKAYPAFQLKIYAADQSTVVYDSGVQQAPVRGADGMYEWTAPAFVGQILGATENYYWAVSMLDAKFTAFNDDEAKTPFKMACTGNINDGNGYGSIQVAVKYFGPLVGSLSTSGLTLPNLIHVQAFTTPDFTGTPVGEAYVTDVESVSSISAVTVNAIIRGVKPGTYYVRAFVDTDSDRRKSFWETWGYGCYVGDGNAPFITISRGNRESDNVTAANFPYTPQGYTVAVGAAVPVATIYMEDADTDFDGFPDAWEMLTYGTLATRAPISGNTFFATVNPNLLTSLSGYTLGSTVSESTVNLGFSLMSVLLSGSDDAVTMAATLLSAGPNRNGGTMAVGIKSFSLEDGLTLEIKNETTPVASDLISFKDEANVQLYLVCAVSPDFADAVEVRVKEITIRANDTVVEAVSGDELAAARAKVPNARFFKAVIK